MSSSAISTASKAYSTASPARRVAESQHWSPAMRLDQLPRSDRVEDQRGQGPSGLGRAGGLGLSTIIILGLIGWALGINPMYLIGGAELLNGLGGSPQQSQPAPGNAQKPSSSDQMSQFVSAVLGSTEVQW